MIQLQIITTADDELLHVGISDKKPRRDKVEERLEAADVDTEKVVEELARS